MNEQAAEFDHIGVLTMADIVALGEAVLTLDGEPVGFDHNVAERIVRKHVARTLREAADRMDRHCSDWAAEYAETESDADYGRWDGWTNAARIVRERADAIANPPEQEADR